MMGLTMKDQIATLLTDILKEMGIPGVVPEVEVPEDAAHGDYTTNIAMKIWRSPQSPQTPKFPQFSSPMEIALSVKKAISYQLSAVSQKEGGQNIGKGSHSVSPKLPLSPILSAIDRVDVAPPGFINIFLTEASLSSELVELLKSGEAATTVQSSVVSLPAGKAGRQSSDMSDSRKLKTDSSFRVIVEYAHPNTHKAFHIGHLRNITTGESIIRLLESQGNTIIRANYQGDVGMHIAKALYSLLHSPLSPPSPQSPLSSRIDFLGKAYAAGSKAFEEDPTAKEEIVSLNALIYASAQRLARERGIDPGTTDYMALVKDEYKDKLEKIYTLWKETRRWSLDYFETIYKRVGSHYDRYYFESECLAGVDLARNAVKKGLPAGRQGVLKTDAGAVIFDGKPYGIDTRVFINSKGLPTYEGKELKLSTMETSEHGKIDRIIHVVGPEQTSFFQVTFKAEELLGIVKPGVQYHLVYGWVKLKHGKMSSRSGNVVLGEWLLDEAKKAIYSILDKTPSISSSPISPQSPKSPLSSGQKEEIAEKAAVAAVKYAFLKVGTTSEIAFDIKESVNFQGDSGPYLQYTYARCKSVLRKSQLTLSDVSDVADVSLNSEERSVLRLLTHFPDVVADSANCLSPSTLCTYLFKLAQAFNLFYAKHQILSSKQKVASSKGKNDVFLTTSYLLPTTIQLRLALTAATAQVLKNGLYLLGIETLEQM